LGVAGVMALDPFGQQPFAPPLATARERGAATFGFHAGAKAVLAFARSFGRLVSAFHRPSNSFGAILERLQ
jgi:hypothetical protein